jgi:thiol-disulfide isomerase/thioredoxin
MPRSLVFLLLLLFPFSFGCTETNSKTGTAGQGTTAHEIAAKSWLNSEPLTLASRSGKVTVVEFWATWCPPCRKSIPHLNGVAEKYQGKDVLLIGLTNEDRETVEPFAKQIGMKYPVGIGSRTGQDYGVQGIPSAFVIGKDGKIAWSGHPMSGLEAAIDQALSK